MTRRDRVAEIERWYETTIAALLAAESLEELESVVYRQVIPDSPAGHAARDITDMLPAGVAEELQRYRRPMRTVPHLVAALRRRFERSLNRSEG